MARPRKTGLAYFNLDCVLDTKVEMLQVAHSNDGFAVWIKLLQEIYQTENGVLDISDVLRRRTLAKRANISEEHWNNIVKTCVDVGLFDEEAFARDMLTSNGVRKRLETVAEEREKARRRAADRSSAKNPPKNGGKGKGKGNRKDTPPKPPGGEGKKKLTADKIWSTMAYPKVLDTTEFRENWLKWIGYRMKRSKPATEWPEFFQVQLDRIAPIGHASALFSVQNSITNGYIGLIPKNAPSEQNGQRASDVLNGINSNESHAEGW